MQAFSVKITFVAAAVPVTHSNHRHESNALDEDKQNAIDVGMNCHITKPINVKKLITTLVEA